MIKNCLSLSGKVAVNTATLWVVALGGALLDIVLNEQPHLPMQATLALAAFPFTVYVATFVLSFGFITPLAMIGHYFLGEKDPK